MRKSPPRKLEEGRVTSGAMELPPGVMWGAFKIEGFVLVSSGVDIENGWEHVSVSGPHVTPVWDVMCWAKKLFWHDDEIVVQYHPAKADYVNHHPHCLHLWKKIGEEFPVPPSILVGPK